MNERYLAAVQEFDPAQLSRRGPDLLRDLPARARCAQRESERFPDYLLPLDADRRPAHD